LSDVGEPALVIVCEPCERRGATSRLLARKAHDARGCEEFTALAPSEKAASTASGGGGAGNPPGLAQAKNLLVHFQRLGMRELPMAKGQRRSAKEAKKPKANKPKTSVSDYKKSVIASGHK
jgi:hypothetical protein